MRFGYVINNITFLQSLYTHSLKKTIAYDVTDITKPYRTAITSLAAISNKLKEVSRGYLCYLTAQIHIAINTDAVVATCSNS